MKKILFDGINLFFQIIYWIMLARVLFTWFPNLDWYRQPFRAIKEITDPIFEPFRRIVPPIGGIDFSPIIAFIALGVVQYLALVVIAYI